MSRHDSDRRRHGHRFDVGNPVAARHARVVLWVTAGMMLIEVAAGWTYNSMALVADGFHLVPQVMAAGSSALAYSAVRRRATDEQFAFCTWRMKARGRLASAAFLLVVVAFLLACSVERLFEPQPIRYREAIWVASLALVVNGFSALLLEYAQHQPHGEQRGPSSHGNAQRAYLYRESGYVEMAADAATALLAMIALIGGGIYGLTWMDPAAGLLGAVVVAMWAKRLWSDSCDGVLDRKLYLSIIEEIRKAIELGRKDSVTRLINLEVWPAGDAVYGCSVSLVTCDPGLTASTVRGWIAENHQVVHSTIDIKLCS